MHPDSPPSKGVNHPNPSRPFSEAKTDNPILSSPLNTKYPLPPLQNPKEEIRLLRFQPADTETTLGVELTAHRLDALPEYHAISYTWGAPSETATISINSQLTSVRQSCYYSLWQVRSQYPDAYVWIDSICIDQNNTSEKNHQVQKMGQIYASANNVLACLGPHAAGSEKLIQRRQQKELRATDKEPTLEIMKAFWRRPYWKRLWVVQELKLAKRVRFLCGEHIMEFSDLSLLPWLSRWSDNLYPEAVGVPDYVHQIIRGEHAKSDLWHTVMSHGSRICSDPRDHVFALLSICEPDPLRDPIMVDYSIGAPALAFDLLKRLDATTSSKSLFDYSSVLSALGVGSATGLHTLKDFRMSIYRADCIHKKFDDLVLAASWDSYPIKKELPDIFQTFQAFRSSFHAATIDVDIEGHLLVRPPEESTDLRPPRLQDPFPGAKPFKPSSEVVTEVELDVINAKSVETLTARVTSAARPGDLLLLGATDVYRDWKKRSNSAKRADHIGIRDAKYLQRNDNFTHTLLDTELKDHELVVVRWIGPGLWKAIGQAHITACIFRRPRARAERDEAFCLQYQPKRMMYPLMSAEAFFMQQTHCYVLHHTTTAQQRISTLDEIASHPPPPSYYYIPDWPQDLEDCRTRLEPEWYEKFCQKFELQEARAQHTWPSKVAMPEPKDPRLSDPEFRNSIERIARSMRSAMSRREKPCSSNAWK